MLRELYDLFEKKTEIVLNKVLNASSSMTKETLQAKMKDLYQAPLLGVIPCFCDILKAEGNIIFVEEKPEHPFTKILDGMANEISHM